MPSAAPARGAQADRGGRAAGAAGRGVAVGTGPVDHQALVAHLGDQAGDGGPRQPGVAGHVGPAGHPELAQRVDHAAPVQLAHGRRRLTCPSPHTAARVSIVTSALCQGRGQIRRNSPAIRPDRDSGPPPGRGRSRRAAERPMVAVMLTPSEHAAREERKTIAYSAAAIFVGAIAIAGRRDGDARRSRELDRAGHRRPGPGRGRGRRRAADAAQLRWPCSPRSAWRASPTRWPPPAAAPPTAPCSTCGRCCGCPTSTAARAPCSSSPSWRWRRAWPC